jgi:hypothetical protein
LVLPQCLHSIFAIPIILFPGPRSPPISF